MRWIVQGVPIVVLLVAMLLGGPLTADSGCAQFITTGDDDAPNSGWLVGESTVSTSVTTRFSGAMTFMTVGGTYEGSRTRTESYSVGTYQMEDGTTVTVRCDTYTRV
jgi:hypothetical protein